MQMMGTVVLHVEIQRRGFLADADADEDEDEAEKWGHTRCLFMMSSHLRARIVIEHARLFVRSLVF